MPKRDRTSATKGRIKAPRPTLAHVAERAGVSVSAASFVLSGRTDQRISTETSARVRAAAEDLGYRPNTVAKTLLTGKSGTVAFVSEFVASTPYATRMIAGALREALRHDTLMFVAETLGEANLERRLLHSLVDRRVDAFLYAAMFTREIAIPELLRDAELVLLNCTSDDVDAPMVLPDEVSAGRSVVQALLRTGHRDDIYYIGDVPGASNGIPKWGDRIGLAVTERLDGIRAELADHGCSLAGTPPVKDWEPDDGRRAVETLISTGAAPKAIICANDKVAVGAYQALQTYGLRIPDDVSIVSFDDSELTEIVRPGLSSVALPHEEMGRLAIELLLATESQPGRHIVPMTLVERGSIGPPRTGPWTKPQGHSA